MRRFISDWFWGGWLFLGATILAFASFLSLHAVQTIVLWTWGREDYLRFLETPLIWRLLGSFIVGGFAIMIWLVEWIFTWFRATPFF